MRKALLTLAIFVVLVVGMSAVSAQDEEYPETIILSIVSNEPLLDMFDQDDLGDEVEHPFFEDGVFTVSHEDGFVSFEYATEAEDTVIGEIYRVYGDGQITYEYVNDWSMAAGEEVEYLSTILLVEGEVEDALGYVQLAIDDHNRYFATEVSLAGEHDYVVIAGVAGIVDFRPDAQFLLPTGQIAAVWFADPDTFEMGDGYANGATTYDSFALMCCELVID